MKKLKILLAEDDKNLGTVLKAYLDAKGHDTILAIDGEEALKLFYAEDFDFCILDVMMPLKDGFAVTKQIRKSNKTIPILFLTAKSQPHDIITGFNTGADDYITKPFRMEELMARIKAIMRRTTSGLQDDLTHQVYHIGNYSFDFTSQILKIGDTEFNLTAKEAELLKILVENANEVIDRSIILQNVWKDDSYFTARSMDVYISRLRKYLQEDRRVQNNNSHKVGFRLVVPED